MFRQPENKLSISGRVKRAVQGGVNERRSSLARLLFCAARACTFHGRAIFVWSWKMVSVSIRYLFYQPMERKPKKKALFDWPIVLQYGVKAKYRLISRKFSDMTFCHPSVQLTSQKPRTILYPFDKPIKSLYFRSFVISVLCARF